METPLGAQRSRPVLRKALMYRPAPRPLAPDNPLEPSRGTGSVPYRGGARAISPGTLATKGRLPAIDSTQSRLNDCAPSHFYHDADQGSDNSVQSELMTIARASHQHLFNQHQETAELQDLVNDEKPRFLPLSRTTDRVLSILLTGDLYRLRAESVAEALGISCTTLRRRLRNDHTSYQFLLDRARQFRCEALLSARWLPGKCLADELGYLEVNSFYRAFRRWTGLSYSEYRLRYD
ncbi:MAG: AraC family transcriptional regulator [Pseudomonadota bacterium]